MDSKTEPASEAERIEREAKDYADNNYKKNHYPDNWENSYCGYIAGANEEYNRAQEEIPRLKAELERERKLRMELWVAMDNARYLLSHTSTDDLSWIDNLLKKSLIEKQKIDSAEDFFKAEVDRQWQERTSAFSSGPGSISRIPYVIYPAIYKVMNDYAAQQLSEYKEYFELAEKAKQVLRDKGYGWTGLDILKTCKLVPNSGDIYPDSDSEYKEVLKDLLPLAQTLADILRWDEEYSGDGVGGKEAQEIIDRAKALLQGSNQGQPPRE